MRLQTADGKPVRPQEIAERLAQRARILAIVLLFGAVWAGMFSLPLWFSPPGSGYFFFVLAVFITLMAVGSAFNVAEVKRAGAVLDGIPRLRVTKAQGIYVPRIRATVMRDEEDAPPLDVRFQGSIIFESVADVCRFSMRLPWNSPIDVDLTSDRNRTPPSRINDLLDEIGRGLPSGEILRVLREENVLLSWVTPDWGHVFVDNESVDGVRSRIMDRWVVMERVCRAEKSVLKPTPTSV